MPIDDLPRPDFSEYVVHFTKLAAPLGHKREDAAPKLADIAGLSAFDRLTAILTDNMIYASNMPWSNALCVCFTECVWDSLLAHAQRYSAYAIGFKKETLFSVGGGPALYVRRSLFLAQQKHKGVGDGWHPTVLPFITPFNPRYAKGLEVDYSHEREWRVPGDFEFAPDKVEFVIVRTYEDEARMPTAIKDSIGREKILIMDNYRTIRGLWPAQH